MKVKIGNRLKSLRGQDSQATMAKLMGVSQPCWQAWETNKNEPSSTTIRDICERLNCSADWLLGLKKNLPIQDGNTNIIKNKDQMDCSKCDLMKAAIKVIGSNQRVPRK